MSSSNKISVEKLSLAECKKILCKNGKVYSENEIISIRDLLYCFAQIDIDTHYHMEKKKYASTSFDDKTKIEKLKSSKRINKVLKKAA